ncbi:MAG TPA: ORF6N domain-containing protein [Phycisphaerae bacterium]|nr:ORF6N domain-containing protein [Phycisphaerae bacterium]
MPIGKIEQSILLIRGEKVILDTDLAELYGLKTKVLNQAVKRNIDRFPDDFMFQLTWEEAKALRSQSVTLDGQDGVPGSRSQTVTLRRGRNIKYRPRAFTEHGAIMAASMLNSPRAVKVSVYVVRAFVRLRRMLAGHRELAAKLDKLERQVGKHDRQIMVLVDAIRQLMEPPPETPRKRIGFQSEQER